MEVSPLAGKPADPSILIDVEKLVAAESEDVFRSLAARSNCD